MKISGADYTSLDTSPSCSVATPPSSSSSLSTYSSNEKEQQVQGGDPLVPIDAMHLLDEVSDWATSDPAASDLSETVTASVHDMDETDLGDFLMDAFDGTEGLASIMEDSIPEFEV